MRKALWDWVSNSFFLVICMGEVLHSSTGASPIAVVELKTLALEDEPCETVLGFGNGAQALHGHGGRLRGGGWGWKADNMGIR